MRLKNQFGRNQHVNFPFFGWNHKIKRNMLLFYQFYRTPVRNDGYVVFILPVNFNHILLQQFSGDLHNKVTMESFILNIVEFNIVAGYVIDDKG